MSLAPVGTLFPPLRSGTRDAGADGGFFDLLAAAAAVQAQSMGASSEAPFAALGALTSQDPGGALIGMTAQSAAPADSPAQSGISGAELALAASAPLPEEPSSPLLSIRKADHARQAPQTMSDSISFVTHGTLPVIVAGQLIELTVLSERRQSRDAASARRMSMSLDTGASGPLTVKARLEDDCLIVRFEGPSAGALTSRDSYTDEIQALAKRIGWQFKATTVEESA